MPRSFLVKKAYFSPEVDIMDDYRPLTSPAQQEISQQISVVRINKKLDFNSNFCFNSFGTSTYDSIDDQPIDYSMKRRASDNGAENVASIAGSDQSSSSTDSDTNTPYQSLTYEALLSTDGRSKRRKPTTPEKPQRFTCPECGKHYATSSNLSRHKQTHRSLDSNQAKQCPHCKKIYVSIPALSMHILTHRLMHKCSVCDKAFSRPWLLQGHMRSHSGERPYGCAHCGKSFADRSNLRAHMQTHSEEKGYQCYKCHKTFALKSYLTKHNESACSLSASRAESPK